MARKPLHPKPVRPNPILERKPEDAGLAGDYRQWISFVGSHSSTLGGESVGETKGRAHPKTPQGGD